MLPVQRGRRLTWQAQPDLADEFVETGRMPLSDRITERYSDRYTVVELEGLLSRPTLQKRLDNLDNYLAMLRPGSERQPIAERPPWRATDRLSDGVVEGIVAAYLAGSPTTRLADQHGLSKSTVSKLLIDRGVTLRRARLSSPEIEEAAALYAHGWSLAEVGEKFHRQPSVILRAFQKAAVPRRDSHGRQRPIDHDG